MRPQELAPDVDEEMQMLLVDAPAVHLGAGGGGALVIVLPQRAPNGEEEQVDDAEKPDLATRTAEGSSGETGAGTETVLLLSNIDKVGGSFTKDALLGRLCICNGSAASTTLLLELDQKMPTRLLHLTGPVEQQIHIQRAQGITAYLLQTKEESLPYCMAAGFSVGDDRPLPVGLGIAPVNTRVPVKWPSCMKRKDDLISHLPDPKADKAGDANEGCDTTLLLLVVDDKASSPPESVVVDEALSTQDASSRDPNQRREALLYWIQLLNKFGAEHKADWENLPPLLNAAKVKLGDMNTTEMLLRGDANVNEVDAIGNIYGLYWFLICSHQKNQLMKKEGGGWLLDNEFDGLTRCYAGPDASAGLVSIIFSALVARMKSHCDLKQGFTFEIAPANTRIQVKWPLDTSGHDLSYLQDPKAHKIGGTGEVDYRDAMEGCLTLLLLVVVDDKTSPPSVVDKSSKRWREKFKNDDGIELMIPAYNKDLIPDILEKWIYSSKGGGESSKAGKGKQPSQAATSPGFSQPASPASSVSSGRSFLEAFRSAGLHSSSSRFSSPSSQDIKGKGKQRK
nr:unnamed protein product [Digitaria exilis]